jgi:hypothetical protein
MAVELGTFYFDEDAGFPAVVVKVLEDGRVLVRVWTLSGDAQQAALRSGTPGSGVFVSDSA